MKSGAFIVIALILYWAPGTCVAADEVRPWLKVSPGGYLGYAELYRISKGSYVVDGDSSLGSECEFRVSTKGVDLKGEFRPWDVIGFQASHDTKAGRTRVNFRGRVGSLVVADVSFKKPKGTLVNLLRIVATQSPVPDKSNPHAEAPPSGGKAKQ
jgi:hypothetical protein